MTPDALSRLAHLLIEAASYCRHCGRRTVARRLSATARLVRNLAADERDQVDKGR